RPPEETARESKGSRAGRWFERVFSSVKRDYERSLTWTLRHPLLMVLTIPAALILTIFLIIVMPGGFFPQQDTGQLRGGMRGDASASFQSLKPKLQQAVQIIGSDPAVKNVMGTLGGGGGGGFGGAGPQANRQITLKPLSGRSVSADQVITRLRPQLLRIPGAITFLQSQQDINAGAGGGRGSNSQYQYSLLGDDLTELRTWSQKIRNSLQDVKE